MVKPNAASHSGIRHVYVCAFQVSSDVGSLHCRWVTFVSCEGKKEISLEMCENGKRGDVICGFDVRRGHVVVLLAALSCDESLTQRVIANSASRKRALVARE